MAGSHQPTSESQQSKLKYNIMKISILSWLSSSKKHKNWWNTITPRGCTKQHNGIRVDRSVWATRISTQKKRVEYWTTNDQVYFIYPRKHPHQHTKWHCLYAWRGSIWCSTYLYYQWIHDPYTISEIKKKHPRMLRSKSSRNGKWTTSLISKDRTKTSNTLSHGKDWAPSITHGNQGPIANIVSNQ